MLTETTNADDADLLARSTAIVLEWAVHSDTTAEHGRCFFAGKGIRDLHDEVAVAAVVVRVATVGVAAVRVLAGEGILAFLAVLLETSGALLAIRLQAGVVLSSDTHAVADLDALLSLLAYTNSLADDLMADAAWVGCWAPAGTEGVQVTAADAAVGDLDVDVGLLEGLGVRKLLT
jgi:hypothetical protein